MRRSPPPCSFASVKLRLAILFALAAAPCVAQRGAPRVDSALVRRILVAEDMRDSASSAFGDGARSQDPRIRELARRALARIRDPRFALRDSFPTLPAPPAYPDAAWRVRYRALANIGTNCAAILVALADSVWHLRLRAADVADRSCANDASVTGTLRAWASALPASARRDASQASWQPAAHALVALARISPADAKPLMQRFYASPIPAVRVYAARAAGVLSDVERLRVLAHDRDDNVKEAAIDALAKLGHVGDSEFISALQARGYQAVRAAARALKESPRGKEVLAASIAAAKRLRRDSSETSRDARMAVLDRIAEFADSAHAMDIASLATDFDCAIADSAAAIAKRLGGPSVAQCRPRAITLPRDAVALALGREVTLRVTLADSSGGGSFVVRLRSDVAPITAARVLALVRARWYDNRAWYRVEPDFVIQGGGPGSNEYAGHPCFSRDELGSVPQVRGTVGMSTRGHDTGDAQWYVNLRDNLRLGRDYTLFGEVTEGIDVVDGILEGDVIARIEIVR